MTSTLEMFTCIFYSRILLGFLGKCCLCADAKDFWVMEPKKRIRTDVEKKKGGLKWQKKEKLDNVLSPKHKSVWTEI